MKRFTILFTLLLISNLFAQPKVEYKSSVFDEGTILLYTVWPKDEPSYSLLIKINHIKEYIAFDFAFNYSGPGFTGSVIIDDEAIKSADGLKNYFGPGYDELRANSTVWLSRKMYNDIKQKGKTTIKMDGKPIEFFYNEESLFQGLIFSTTMLKSPGTGDDEFLVYDQTEEFHGFKSLMIESADGNKIFIWDNPNCPIILLMEYDFEIRLDVVL